MVHMVLERLRALLSTPPPATRTTGLPTSANGASSHHLFWTTEVDPENPIVAVEVDLEIVEAPSIDRLYFWALQATFRAGAAQMGGAHLGLQWHPDYPGSTAANWGGYHGRDAALSGELTGSALALPSALHNPNTCNFAWTPAVPYRLRIALAEPGRWTGSIGRVGDPSPVTLRTLHCDGDHLTDFVVWTESFAECDAPPAVVRWANPTIISAAGGFVAPAGARTNYQTVADGGCSTSDSVSSRGGLVQATGTTRTTPQGALLRF